MAAEEPVLVFGRVYDAELTDLSVDAVEINALLVGQAGHGPDGSDPAADDPEAPAWTWLDAAPNLGYGNDDEYMATLVTPLVVGSHDLAFRFSLDGGRTWTYCDGDEEGSTDGYEPGSAGTLVVADECSPELCPGLCGEDGASVLAGSCEVVAGAARCSVGAGDTLDCWEMSQICWDGQCRGCPDPDAATESLGDAEWTRPAELDIPDTRVGTLCLEDNAQDYYQWNVAWSTQYLLLEALAGGDALGLRCFDDPSYAEAWWDDPRSALWLSNVGMAVPMPIVCFLQVRNETRAQSPGSGHDAVYRLRVDHSRLLFGEYVEGSGEDKALEIYNHGPIPVDLAYCSVRVYADGSRTPSETLELAPLAPPTLGAGETWVLCHEAGQEELLQRCQATAAAGLGFDGNDAVALVCGGTLLDVVGVIGQDPRGGAWQEHGGGASTRDHTLRRRCHVTTGEPTVSGEGVRYVLERTWEGHGVDAFDGLGEHTAGCGP